MQTEAFLAYKDQFTTYLRDFIIGMQQTSYQIQSIIKRLSPDRLHPFLEKVVEHQIKAFRFEDADEKRSLGEQLDKWETLRSWFLGDAIHQSEYDLLEERTNESIRRITRVMQRLSERHQHFHSRKKDYLHLANWFSKMEDVKEAHKLSAIAFGISHTKHLHSDHIPTDDIYTDVWEEAPMGHETRPRIQGYTERTKAGAVSDHSTAKRRVREEHQEQRMKEKLMIEKYITNGQMDTRTLPVIEPYIRKLLLSWIGKAMGRQDRKIKTNMGERVLVRVSQNEKVVIRSFDGEMEMPAITFHFLDREENSTAPADSSEERVSHGTHRI